MQADENINVPESATPVEPGVTSEGGSSGGDGAAGQSAAAGQGAAQGEIAPGLISHEKPVPKKVEPEKPKVETVVKPVAGAGNTLSEANAAPLSGAETLERVKPEGGAKLSAEMDAEIEAAMSQMDMGDGSKGGPKKGSGKGKKGRGRDVLRDSRHDVSPIGGPAKAISHPRVVEGGREHRSGKVVSVGPTDVFVEFGPKELGVVERKQYTEADLPKAGDEIDVVVQRFEASESIFICSRPGVVQKAEWEMLSAGQVVEARVTGVNKGGLELEIAKHRAFMPASQVDTQRIPDLGIFVGEKITCKVQRVDRRGSGNIVLSRRDIVAVERAEAASKLRELLKVGDTVSGTVRKIMPFGAFVSLGGVDGLLHISDLCYERIMPGEKNVERYVKEGQEVRVQIVKIDWEANRISLGLKQLQADPFQTAAEDITEGADVTGKVTRLAEFGAFIEVAPGVEGLAHISELEWRRVGHPSEVLQEGEIVQCRVLKLDTASRKVSLSLKALKEPPAAPRGAGGAGGRGGAAGGGGGGRGGARGGGGRGRGRGERDDRNPEEILKELESPKLRRMREKAKQKAKQESIGEGGLGDIGGVGFGNLKL